MILVYLDEFGHVGPYFGRAHAQFNHSPLFGLGGIILPEDAVRPFASFFLKRKTDLLGFEIEKSGREPYEWEKHGSNLYTRKSITKYPEIRATTFRIMNQLKALGGRVFYYGREKIKNREDVNPTGLYKTVLSDAIRQLDKYCTEQKQNFVLVVDENSARKELLETAVKTMYGHQRALQLASPPFEVESYLNQNMQAADWLAALIGHMWCHRLEPAEHADLEPYTKYFWHRIGSVATHSSVLERKAVPKKSNWTAEVAEVVILAEDTAFAAAYFKAKIKKAPDGL